ncbi:MAG: winged helix-turn-helix transcriptional regulator [Acidobacteria bacterium]|nr:winged helix-turn-helix transcriptional regulator [Acidobacteriota bacterium]
MQTKNLNSLYLQSPKLNQLNILREVAASARITQAELAARCSLSVAMVNNYMKDLCGTGLLEYKRKSVKSVTYHLTPSGEQYLETLQTELIGEMAAMFAAAKEQIRSRIMHHASSALQRVVLYGSGHLAQLAFHALESSGIKVLGVCDDDPSKIGGDFCGREVGNLSQIRFLAPDALIVAKTNLRDEILGELNALARRGIELIYLDNQKAGSAGDSFMAGSSLTKPEDPNTKPTPFSLHQI